MKSHSSVRLMSGFSKNIEKARNATNLHHIACYSSRTDTKTLLERALSPFVPSSEASLAQKLIEEAIFYAKGDVLVVNKPYGISLQGQKDLKGILFKNFPPPRKFDDFVDDARAKKDPGITLESCLPLLQKHYLGEELTLVGGLKRYVSGPVIIPCKKKYVSKMRRSKLAICTGKFMKEGETGTVFGYCSQQQNSQSIPEYIFTPGGSKKASKKEEKLVTRDAADYEVLASYKGMSLIDLQFSKFNMHFPRLVLSYLGCPVFGDKIYLQRLIQEGNEVTCVDPKDLWRAADRQYLPTHFMKLIGANKADYLKLQEKIPLYMAVVQSIYPEFGNTKETTHSEFVARAQVPDHFYAMAKLLGFHTHIQTFMKSLEVEETDDFSLENLQRVKTGTDAQI